MLNLAWDSWQFYLPATLVSFWLYLLWLLFGQSSVLPLDLNTTLLNRPLVGQGRGLTSVLFVPLVAALCAVGQGRGDDALVLALGGHIGMVANSFGKRRLGIARGEPCLPWDHVDFILGSTLAYSFQSEVDWSLFLSGLVVCGGAHFSVGRLLRSVMDPLLRERAVDPK